MALIKIGGRWINPRIVLEVSDQHSPGDGKFEATYVRIEGEESPLRVFATNADTIAREVNDALAASQEKGVF